MSTKEIISEIDKLPLQERLLLVELTLKKIRSAAIYDQITLAAEELADEYRTNKELTVFTQLDFENFYEAR